jgi:hypothetical protein
MSYKIEFPTIEEIEADQYSTAQVAAMHDEILAIKGKAMIPRSNNSGLLQVISDLQDEISERDEIIESLEGFCRTEINKLPPEYVKHKQGG